MVKILLPVFVLIIVSAVIFLRFIYQPVSKPAQTQASNDQTEESISLPQNPESSQSAFLVSPLSETSVDMAAINKQLNSLNQKVAKIASLNSKVNILQETITDLQSKVAKLEQAQTSTQVTSTATSTSKKTPLYIPLGNGGGITATDWTSLTGQEIQLNGDDYPGYSAMYFEGSLRCYQGNGKAYARIYNATDGTAITSADFSTSSQDYTSLSSDGFKIASGKNTYRIQLKTLTGYEAGLQNPRIKVVF